MYTKSLICTITVSCSLQLLASKTFYFTNTPKCISEIMYNFKKERVSIQALRLIDLSRNCTIDHKTID